MNNLRRILLLLLIIPALSQCSKFSIKTFDKTVILDFVVDLQDPEALSIDLTAAVTAATGDLAKYKDDIESYRIKSIRYKIWEYWTDEEGEDVSLTGSLGIGNTYASDPGVLFELIEPSLKEAALRTEHTEITLSAAEMDKIQQQLLKTHGLRFWLTGDVSSAPVHFVLQIVMDVEAKAETKD